MKHLPHKKRVNYFQDNLMLKIVRERKLNYMYKQKSEIYVYDKIQNPNGIYLFKVNNKNSRKVRNNIRALSISKLTMKTPEWSQWRRFDDFIGNFEQIWVTDLMFPLLIFEQVIASWRISRDNYLTTKAVV